MEHNDDIQKKDIEETSHDLFTAGKENPFDVPLNYFERLNNEISEKCIQSEKPESVRIIKGAFRKVLIPLAIAASVLLIILTSQRKKEHNSNYTDQYAFNENSSISDYLESLIDNDELDESIIISELVNDDTSKTSSKNNQAEKRINSMNENPVVLNDSINKISITEDDIIQYLLEEDESDELIN